jgi:hypothetical protein
MFGKITLHVLGPKCRIQVFSKSVSRVRRISLLYSATNNNPSKSNQFRFQGNLDKVHRSGLLGFWTLSIVRYSKKNTTFGNWICFCPRVRGQETPTQLGPLERASLNHWITCRKLDLFLSSGEGAGDTYSVGPVRKS